MRALALGLVLLVPAAVACLPEIEDPPISATGEAPVGWTPATAQSATGGTTAATGTSTTCSGVYFGNVPPIAGAPFVGTPCEVNGQLTPGAMTAAQIAQVAKVTKAGSLQILAQDQWAKVAALKSVSTLVLAGFVGQVAVGPATLDVTNAINISGQMTGVGGFGGVKNLPGGLVIQSVPKLTAVTGFEGLQSVGAVNISGSAVLKTINAFGALKTAQSLYFADFKTTTVGNTTTGIAFTPLKISTVNDVKFYNCQGLGTLNVLQTVGAMQSLELSNLDTGTLQFTALSQLALLKLSGLPNLHSLDGLGSNLQVTGSLSLCDLGVTPEQRESWRAVHAPGLAIPKCATGCKGDGTCP